MISGPELRLVDADAPVPGSEVEGRVLDAAVVLVGRWGVAKTALADVAKEAGCSRATLYRAFPGGKQHLMLSLAQREVSTYVLAIAEAIDAGDDLADALTRSFVVATRLLRDHDAAQFILEHEPGLLLPFLGFQKVERLYRATSTVLGPHFERFLDPDRAAWAAEWATRLFISHLFSPRDDLDLAVIDDVRRLVETFLVPALAPHDLPASPRAS